MIIAIESASTDASVALAEPDGGLIERQLAAEGHLLRGIKSPVGDIIRQGQLQLAAS